MNEKLRYVIIGLIIGLIIGGFTAYIYKGTPGGTEYSYPRGKFTYPPSSDTQVTIIYGFDPEYPPFTQVLPNGSAAGFDIDVINWIAKKYGWKIIYKPWDWSTIVDALVRGDIDIIASGMTITASRCEKIWFSIPYYSYVHELVVRINENRSFDNILNSGEYIAVQIGSTADEWAERLLKSGYKFKKLGLNSYVEVLDALLDERASAIITDSAFIGPYLRKNPDIASKIKVLTTIGPPYTYGIATRPEDTWLRNMINKALEELMNSPEWDVLLRKWNLSG